MGYRTYTCPIARRCGGCEWLAVPYPLQLERKQRFVADLFGHMAKEDGASIDTVRGMAEPLAYRYKCATPFAPGKKGRLRCGFYAAGSHRIVPCKQCLVEHPLGRATIETLARCAAHYGISAYHEDSGQGLLRHAVVRCAHAYDAALLTLVVNAAHLPHARELASAVMHDIPQVKGVVMNINTQRGNAILGRSCHTLRGSDVLHDKLLNCSFDIGPTSFYQTNPAQTEVLYREVIQGSGLDTSDHWALCDARYPWHGGQRACRVLDTYCGCGTIGICLASQAVAHSVPIQVVGVERVSSAVMLARRNAALNNVEKNCTFIRDDATVYLQKLAEKNRRDKGSASRVPPFDIVVMDPPRAGSTPAFLSALCSIAPHRIIYVSCNVVTQARDLERLREGGYRIQSVIPVDMFPHTKHVECMVVLTKA